MNGFELNGNDAMELLLELIANKPDLSKHDIGLKINEDGSVSIKGEVR